VALGSSHPTALELSTQVGWLVRIRPVTLSGVGRRLPLQHDRADGIPVSEGRSEAEAREYGVSCVREGFRRVAVRGAEG